MPSLLWLTTILILLIICSASEPAHDLAKKGTSIRWRNSGMAATESQTSSLRQMNPELLLRKRKLAEANVFKDDTDGFGDDIDGSDGVNGTMANITGSGMDHNTTVGGMDHNITNGGIDDNITASGMQHNTSGHDIEGNSKKRFHISAGVIAIIVFSVLGGIVCFAVLVILFRVLHKCYKFGARRHRAFKGEPTVLKDYDEHTNNYEDNENVLETTSEEALAYAKKRSSFRPEKKNKTKS